MLFYQLVFPIMKLNQLVSFIIFLEMFITNVISNEDGKKKNGDLLIALQLTGRRTVFN